MIRLPKPEEEVKPMTCSSCGAYVAPGVRFCSNCGAAASDPESTRIARLQSHAIQRGADDDLEHVIFTVESRSYFFSPRLVSRFTFRYC